jgi:hypothetical protein
MEEKRFEVTLSVVHHRSCKAATPTSLCTDDATANQLWKLSLEAVGL